MSPRCVNHPDRTSRVSLDGDDLCQECANAWARGEGEHAAWLEAQEAEHADTSARNVPAGEGQKQEPSSSCANPSPPVVMRHGSDANAELSGAAKPDNQHPSEGENS